MSLDLIPALDQVVDGGGDASARFSGVQTKEGVSCRNVHDSATRGFVTFGAVHAGHHEEVIADWVEVAGGRETNKKLVRTRGGGGCVV